MCACAWVGGRVRCEGRMDGWWGGGGWWHDSGMIEDRPSEGVRRGGSGGGTQCGARAAWRDHLLIDDLPQPMQMPFQCVA